MLVVGLHTNIALGKPTRQSTVEFGGVSSKAVDGSRSGFYSDSTITYTANPETYGLPEHASAWGAKIPDFGFCDSSACTRSAFICILESTRLACSSHNVPHCNMNTCNRMSHFDMFLDCFIIVVVCHVFRCAGMTHSHGGKWTSAVASQVALPPLALFDYGIVCLKR